MGLRVYGLGFRAVEFSVAFKFKGLGFQGLGFRGLGFRGLGSPLPDFKSHLSVLEPYSKHTGSHVN